MLPGRRWAGRRQPSPPILDDGDFGWGPGRLVSHLSCTPTSRLAGCGVLTLSSREAEWHCPQHFSWSLPLLGNQGPLTGGPMPLLSTPRRMALLLIHFQYFWTISPGFMLPNYSYPLLRLESRSVFVQNSHRVPRSENLLKSSIGYILSAGNCLCFIYSFAFP